MATSSCSYYDIDSILAEEELVPCTTLFDFSHLAHLDPDARHGQSHLSEASHIKMPLWAVEKWANMGFVRLALPKHYSRKSRERLDADPGDADLRKRNERFFMAGRMLVSLIEKSTIKVAREISKSKSSRRTAHTRALEQVSQEAQELRRTLQTCYAGERLRRTFDWALSSGGDDDVSQYLSKLTELEKRLFYQGEKAVSDHAEWMMFGNRQWLRPKLTATPVPSKNTARAVTPGEDSNQDGNDRETKRRRMNQ